MNTHKEKTQFKAFLTPETIQNFKQMIAIKYKTVGHGLISEEVEEALKSWIKQQGTHNGTQIDIKPQPKIFAVWGLVRNYLIKKYGYAPDNVRLSEIKEAIEVVRGGDGRTINRWYKDFVKWDFIKEVSPMIYELKHKLGGLE